MKTENESHDRQETRACVTREIIIIKKWSTIFRDPECLGTIRHRFDLKITHSYNEGRISIWQVFQHKNLYKILCKNLLHVIFLITKLAFWPFDDFKIRVTLHFESMLLVARWLTPFVSFVYYSKQKRRHIRFSKAEFFDVFTVILPGLRLAAQGDLNLGFNWEALLDARKPTTWLQYINLN